MDRATAEGLRMPCPAASRSDRAEAEDLGRPTRRPFGLPGPSSSVRASASEQGRMRTNSPPYLRKPPAPPRLPQVLGLRPIHTSICPLLPDIGPTRRYEASMSYILYKTVAETAFPPYNG